MNTFVLPFLMAAPPAGAEVNGPASLFSTFVPIILIFVILYFLMIRPQNKKRKETEKMLAALKKGDRIVTIGGLYGTVQNVKDTTVIIKADDNVKLEFLRSAISSVITPSKEDRKENEDNNGENEKSEGQSSGE
jgi:preprotein translocase subunit YajC